MTDFVVDMEQSEVDSGSRLRKQVIHRRRRCLRLGSLGAAAGTVLTLLFTALPARAATEYLPWPGTVSCGSAYTVSSVAWPRYKFVANSTTTITEGTALVGRVPTGDLTTVVDILATDGWSDSIGATLLGTLIQTSYTPTSVPVFGTAYTVTYTGAITLSPGTYWISVRGTANPTPAQLLCVTSTIASQAPWSFDLTPPYAYYTNDGGTSYSSQGGTVQAPYVSLSSASTSGGSTSSNPAPQTFDLSISTNDGTSCSNTSPSGNSGTWIKLPGASDCTAPPTMPGATLLGWATNPNFPVEIAQRQVDNGWGAYETFNDEGQLTGVFIPAGGSTLVSASGRLYTIWSE